MLKYHQWLNIDDIKVMALDLFKEHYVLKTEKKTKERVHLVLTFKWQVM